MQFFESCMKLRVFLKTLLPPLFFFANSHTSGNPSSPLLSFVQATAATGFLLQFSGDLPSRSSSTGAAHSDHFFYPTLNSENRRPSVPATTPPSLLRSDEAADPPLRNSPLHLFRQLLRSLILAAVNNDQLLLRQSPSLGEYPLPCSLSTIANLFWSIYMHVRLANP